MGTAATDRTISTPAGQLVLAGPLRRLGARIIDAFIVGIPAGIIVGVAAAANRDLIDLSGRSRFSVYGSDWSLLQEAFREGAWGLVLAILFVLVAAAVYEIALTATRGQTVGKMALNTKVIRPENADVPGWGPATARWALPTILGYIPLIGPPLQAVNYLWLLWDPERRCGHDFAAGTRVVRTDLQPAGPPAGYPPPDYPPPGSPPPPPST